MTLRYGILPGERLKLLKSKLLQRQKLRIMEAHDGLSGIIANTSLVTFKSQQENKDVIKQFDGLWISSLTDSSAKGHPDTAVIDFSSRLQTIQEITAVTDKLLIVDADTGGEADQFEYFCRKLELLGVGAVVVEDKQYPKRNSLDTTTIHNLEDPLKFANKINRAKSSCLSKDFMVFARIESFISGIGLEDAIHRAEIYLKSMADGVLIHSSSAKPNEVYSFIEAYKKLMFRLDIQKPIICIPTTYNEVKEEELFEKGFDIVINANHLLRAAHKSMRDVCYSILSNGRSFESTPMLSSTKTIFEDVGFGDIKTKDDLDSENPTQVLILAAGQPYGLKKSCYEDFPISNIPIKNNTLLEYQTNILKRIGLKNVTLISGYNQNKINLQNLNIIRNEEYNSTNSLYSLFLGLKKEENDLIVIFGDIIFDQNLMNKVLASHEDITIAIDPSIKIHQRKKIKPKIDLVVTDTKNSTVRKLNSLTEKVKFIGHSVDEEQATHEFVGIAKFSQYGLQILKSVYADMCQKSKLQVNKDMKDLELSDVLQEIVAQGCHVHGLTVVGGWAEIHSPEDVASVEALLT